jgi:hypothetical protein
VKSDFRIGLSFQNLCEVADYLILPFRTTIDRRWGTLGRVSSTRIYRPWDTATLISLQPRETAAHRKCLCPPPPPEWPIFGALGAFS